MKGENFEITVGRSKRRNTIFDSSLMGENLGGNYVEGFD